MERGTEVSNTGSMRELMSGASRRTWVVRTGTLVPGALLTSAEARWQILGPKKTGSEAWERPRGKFLAGGNERRTAARCQAIPIGCGDEWRGRQERRMHKSGTTAVAYLSRPRHRILVRGGRRCGTNARSFTALGPGFWCHTGGRTSHKSRLIPPEIKTARHAERAGGRTNPGSQDAGTLTAENHHLHRQGPVQPAYSDSALGPPKGGDISGAGPGGPCRSSPIRSRPGCPTHRQKGGEPESNCKTINTASLFPPPPPARTANSQAPRAAIRTCQHLGHPLTCNGRHSCSPLIGRHRLSLASQLIRRRTVKEEKKKAIHRLTETSSSPWSSKYFNKILFPLSVSPSSPSSFFRMALRPAILLPSSFPAPVPIASAVCSRRLASTSTRGAGGPGHVTASGFRVENTLSTAGRIRRQPPDMFRRYAFGFAPVRQLSTMSSTTPIEDAIRSKVSLGHIFLEFCFGLSFGPAH